MKKVYTTNGDEGFTKDYAGNKVPKDDLMINVNGKVDSFQSALDMAILLADEKHKGFLNKVQKKMWQISGEVANCPGDCLIDPVTTADLIELESYVDAIGEPPNKFVRFNTQESIWFNECRVRCRELERELVKLLRDEKLRSENYKYVNRLSSLFFMLGYNLSKN